MSQNLLWIFLRNRRSFISFIRLFFLLQFHFRRVNSLHYLNERFVIEIERYYRFREGNESGIVIYNNSKFEFLILIAFFSMMSSIWDWLVDKKAPIENEKRFSPARFRVIFAFFSALLSLILRIFNFRNFHSRCELLKTKWIEVRFEWENKFSELRIFICSISPEIDRWMITKKKSFIFHFKIYPRFFFLLCACSSFSMDVD